MDIKLFLKNNKQKYILPVIYIIFIYLFSIRIMYEFAGYSEIVSNPRWYIFPLRYGLILTGFLMLFNIINAIYILKINKPSKEILFIAMMIKISFILLYIVYFIIEVIMFYTIIGIPFTVTFFIFGYIVLIPSSFYTICGLIRAIKNNEISILYGICASILSFILFFDVLSTIVSYIKVKKINFNTTALKK